MLRLLSSIGIAIFSAPALAAKPCDELRSEIAAGMTQQGISGFELDIVANEAVDARKVVGSCEGGSKKILYSRGASQAATVAPLPLAAAIKASGAPALRRPIKPVLESSAAVVRPGAAAIVASRMFRDPLSAGGEGPDMVVMPAGEFVMGSARSGIDRRYRESPEHAVSISGFALARTETTFEDYDRFATVTRRRLPADDGQGRGSRPVVNVTWIDAMEYARWLTAQTGFTYRLPSEAEWEYAARAGGKPGASYSTGACISARQANFNDAAGTAFNNCPASALSLGKAQPVASYAPNAFGLYDLHGNVFEWTEDCVHLDYEQAPKDGSAWLQQRDGNCGERMVRGGSWQSGQISVRSSLRAAIGISDSSALIGFRVARALSPDSG